MALSGLGWGAYLVLTGAYSGRRLILGPASRLAEPVSFPAPALRSFQFLGSASIAPALSPVHRHGPQEDKDDHHKAADHNSIDKVAREQVHGQMLARGHHDSKDRPASRLRSLLETGYQIMTLILSEPDRSKRPQPSN